MKAVFAVVVLVLVYLFIPRYTLYVAEDSFTDEYKIKEKNFYKEESCKQKGEALGLRYNCVGTSEWSEIFGKGEAYNKTREAD